MESFNKYKPEDNTINKCENCHACCKNMIMKIESLQRRKAYPNAIRSSFYGTQYLSESCDEGVYYIETNESSHTGFDTFDELVINGDCPNLKDNGWCGIYKRRPDACTLFKKDSKACVDKKLEEFIPDETLKIVR